MAKEFIVAIELGSSKMTGIAGKKNLDGSITVLAVAKEDSTLCIRKGVVYNIDKTTTCLTNIVKKLRNALKTEIVKVYVGVGGQSIHSVKNVIVRNLPADTITTQDMVDSIMDTNRGMTYAEQEILEAATQEYKVDSQYQTDPVGIQCMRLEGNFLNILWRKSFYRNLKKCFDNAGIAVAEMYLSPLATAESVLTDVEKRAGCALIDLGADTTTVSVYYRNILRHLAVIPLGVGNITKDLESLQIDNKAAEDLKIKYASAYTDNNDIDDTQKLTIDNDRKVDARKFIEIVEARMEEIIENVWYQIPNEYDGKLLGGIILTGGGSKMKNITKAFQRFTHEDKIRIAPFVNLSINTAHPELLPHDGTMVTVLGLLAKGDENCAGDEVSNDLFGHTNAASQNATQRGTSREEEEKRKHEEELRRQKEEEDRKAKEKADEERRAAEEEEERRRQRENGPMHKLWKSLKNFGGTIISGDNEA